MAAKVPIAVRLHPETLERLDGYARSRQASRQVVLEAAVNSFLDLAEGGVPDLPAERVVLPARIVRASKLTPADSTMSARQARLNRERS